MPGVTSKAPDTARRQLEAARAPAVAKSYAETETKPLGANENVAKSAAVTAAAPAYPTAPVAVTTAKAPLEAKPSPAAAAPVVRAPADKPAPESVLKPKAPVSDPMARAQSKAPEKLSSDAASEKQPEKPAHRGDIGSVPAPVKLPATKSPLSPSIDASNKQQAEVAPAPPKIENPAPEVKRMPQGKAAEVAPVRAPEKPPEIFISKLATPAPAAVSVPAASASDATQKPVEKLPQIPAQAKIESPLPTAVVPKNEVSPKPKPAAKLPAASALQEPLADKPAPEQLALLTRPAAPVIESKPLARPAPRALEGFIIQVAFSDKETAQSWAEKMQQRGYAVSVTEAGNGSLRVRLGNFPVREEAERRLRDFKQEGVSGIIINLPQAFQPVARSSMP
jgi:cell division septation protein DedD